MRYAGRLLIMLAATAACTNNRSSGSLPDPSTSPGDGAGMGGDMGGGGAGGMGGGHGSGGGSGSGEDGPAICSRDRHGIVLPEHFCATVFADHVGKPRHIAVTPSGHVFVAIAPTSDTSNDGHVLSLFDADDDGVAEQQQAFGSVGGNGIDWKDGE